MPCACVNKVISKWGSERMSEQVRVEESDRSEGATERQRVRPISIMNHDWCHSQFNCAQRPTPSRSWPIHWHFLFVWIIINTQKRRNWMKKQICWVIDQRAKSEKQHFHKSLAGSTLFLCHDSISISTIPHNTQCGTNFCSVHRWFPGNLLPYGK